MTKTPEQLLEDLAVKGGAIICTGQCSVHEINIERALGNMAVREDGIGFIRKGPEWVEMVKEGLAVRAYDVAMRPRPNARDDRRRAPDSAQPNGA